MFTRSTSIVVVLLGICLSTALAQSPPPVSFLASRNFAAGPSRFVAAGDFNGDGKIDLAVADLTDGTVDVLMGNGDGTFRAAVTYNVGPYPISLAVGDFNGDGKLDLAVVGNNMVSVLLGNGDGTFQVALTYAVGMNPSSVAVGDFNGDGKTDLVITNEGDNTVSILIGNAIGEIEN